MKKIVIFSGTTEGRLLAESFAAAGVPVIVCVATEYGQEVMKPDPLITVHTGRMDSDGMESFLRHNSAEIVFDATHPYAEIVSQNIRKAVNNCNIEYRRIERDRSSDKKSGHNIRHVENVSEAVKILEESESRIFLTTGSKELKYFASLRSRLYVRVLPSVEALTICEECGIEKSHIIAQQGPFTAEENSAVIRRYDIGVLVTKNSGKNGGYDDKIRAAREADIPVIVIDRTHEENVLDRDTHISIIGAGCGEKTLTREACNEIRRADFIISTRRILNFDIVRSNHCPKYDSYKPDEIADIIRREGKKRVAVLFSGDVGFYSGAQKTLSVLSTLKNCNIRMIPGISSISASAAAFHSRYDNAIIRSYHGRMPDAEEIKGIVKNSENFYMLLSGKQDIIELGNILNSIGMELTVNIAIDMGERDERFVTLTPVQLTADNIPDGKLYTVEVIH